MQPWQPLLDWWFGADGSATDIAAARRGLWFGKRDSQDREAEARFAALVEQALAGELKGWADEPQAWLAHLILLDQLPRMIFRDTPRAFAGDALARPLLEAGLERGWDRALTPIQRVFAYLIFEHAEDLPLQARAVELFRALLDQTGDAERELFADFLDFAERHQRVIARFGRFPHRNAILGRACTDEEQAFLREPGSRF
ncbi:transmembrane protein [Ectopseudomonas mendocina]|nr:transmembrane protein [Pseudomonas mendocina]